MASADEYSQASSESQLLATLQDPARVISDMPLVQSLTTTSAPPTEPFARITVIPHPSEPHRFQLQANFPLMEKAIIQGYTAKARPSNINTQWITKRIIEKKVLEGAYVECSSNALKMVHPIVLVKKSSDPQVMRDVMKINYSQDANTAQAIRNFRLTLDCAAMNSLRLLQSGDGQVFLVPLHLIHDAKRVIRPKQRNPSGLQVAREMPAGMMVYGKDDTQDAFGQIRLSTEMQPLFGF